MRRIWQFLTDNRTLGAIGLAALLAFLILGADTLQVAAIWAAILAGALLLIAASYWALRYAYRKRAATKLGESVIPPGSEDPSGAEVGILRKGMLEAITKIKTSKLGMARGAAALYELPWYMIIGNPAAGKSSAIGHSGLQFPIAGSKAVQGVAGTRNCDWFFTTDGILLDTAGRYSVQEADRAEWFSFLALLRKYRRRAPINGILIAVSVAELTGANAGASVELAKSLRTRVQELTERLGVYAPVYVIFTKADLIAGFNDFFHGIEGSERDRVWGATIRYNRRRTNQDVQAFFDQRFDTLYDGLKEMSLANMALQGKGKMRPGVFTFPLEFASIKSPLRAFLATLFEENTYQFRPVFRGFYFTSALQEGAAHAASTRRVANRFDLDVPAQEAPAEAHEQSGYFLLDLFRKVIFADKDLVSRYTSPATARLKYGSFFVAAVLLGGLLAGWSWSTISNRQLVANVQADLDKVVKLQDKRFDLQSRLDALDILQDRIEQLQKYRADQPLMLSFGLFQGDTLERKLREEYFAGVREVMLQPVAGSIEALLAEMNANAAQLQPAADKAPIAVKPGQPYQDASPTNVADAYNALKTYLMLGDKAHAETGHLNDQLTRFWRGWLDTNRGTMPREQMIRSAERLITFHLSQLNDPSWPQLPLKLSLMDQARENLRRVVRGTPARERVYADIKARASTRFQSVTVARIVGEQDQALINGSYAVPGTFTRDAWDKFVQGAIKEAANKELQSTDWVLKTITKDDLTLEGSPEQIQKNLIDLYKADYIAEWKKFVQGVTIGQFSGFDASVQAMNRLGDPHSTPLAKLLKTIHHETSWDNPAMSRLDTGKADPAVVAWFKEVVLRRTSSDLVRAGEIAARSDTQGPIGREFAGVARLVVNKEKEASLMKGYLDSLSRLRTRLNQLKNQGDPGPGAKQLMQQTLEGSGSELADALKYVDEQMLTGMSDPQKQALRPLLVRPLMQTFAMIVQPSESELNKTWMAQVVEPFQRTLAAKYPFSPGSRVEASGAEIGQFFGPDGAVAKFVTTSMGPLVVRRGDVLAARTWADMGISLAPQVVSSFPGWIAPLSANGVAASGGPQTVFQILPIASPGTVEYTVEIDGQQVRYRNTQAIWTNMVHPGTQGASGARITALTFDGKTVELFNEPGQFGLKRLIDTAAKKRKDGGIFELKWSNGAVAVAVDLKVVSTAEAGGGDAPGQARGFQGLRLPQTIVGRASAGVDGAVVATVGGQ